jgi:hypothetical protein
MVSLTPTISPTIKVKESDIRFWLNVFTVPGDGTCVVPVEGIRG